MNSNTNDPTNKERSVTGIYRTSKAGRPYQIHWMHACMYTAADNASPVASDMGKSPENQKDVPRMFRTYGLSGSRNRFLLEIFRKFNFKSTVVEVLQNIWFRDCELTINKRSDLQ